PFIGQATMLVVTFLIALGTRDGLASALLPAACYWGLSFLESQVVTPNLLGRTMTINPFLIFLSLTFWLWAWGPVGGLVAVPSLLVLHSVVTHIVPTRAAPPARVRRKLDDKAVEAPAAADLKPKPTPRKPAPAASP
ncbi:MAG: AI-2E family transporter, partial [Devosia sp.]|nr:AI-2E family transporter [Devosia sp.]